MEFFDVFISTNSPEEQEIYSALIQQLSVNSLWETDDGIHAYFDVKAYSKEKLLAEVNETLAHFKPVISVSLMENVNWNKKWESNFDPVEIEDFCYIYAEFHEKKPGFTHYVKIAPKMAFGTGHHDTTYMMMKAMKTIDFKDKSVLDLGCGSGILSVLAAKMKCKDIDAIDIELPSYENTIEHAKLNNVDLNAFHGGLETVPKKQYDIVLANINRGVLTEYSDVIRSFVKENGRIFISGILEQDRDILESHYLQFDQQSYEQKGKWLCFQYIKPII